MALTVKQFALLQNIVGTRPHALSEKKPLVFCGIFIKDNPQYLCRQTWQSSCIINLKKEDTKIETWDPECNHAQQIRSFHEQGNARCSGDIPPHSVKASSLRHTLLWSQMHPLQTSHEEPVCSQTSVLYLDSCLHAPELSRQYQPSATELRVCQLLHAFHTSLESFLS